MLHLSILTPTKSLFNDKVQSIYLQTKTGEIGILPEHAELVAVSVPGEVSLKLADGSDESFVIGAGLVRVEEGNQVTILGEEAYDADSIDEEAAKKAKEEAEKMLENLEQYDEVEFARIQAIIDTEVAKLNIKRKRKRI